MHSSTSNSRAPDSSYLRIWLVALALVLILVATAEFFLRNQGHLPTITDDKAFWAYYRSQVYQKDDRRVIVLVGASRIQVGVVPEVIEERLPGYRVIHLAVDGKPGYATFRDLAEDPQFDGLIVFSTVANCFFPENRDKQEPWVDFYHNQWSGLGGIEKYVNMKTRVFMQNHLVIFTSRLNLRDQLINWFNITPNYYYMQADRYRPINYSDYYALLSPEDLETKRISQVERITSSNNPSTSEKEQEFKQILTTQVAPLVNKLRSHGGDVVFLRMPTCDEHWEVDECQTPKDLYWDLIEDLVGADTIHFKDIEGLDDFECPDLSHLDANDARVFTDRLVDELIRLNYLSK